MKDKPSLALLYGALSFQLPVENRNALRRELQTIYSKLRIAREMCAAGQGQCGVSVNSWWSFKDAIAEIDIALTKLEKLQKAVVCE